MPADLSRSNGKDSTIICPNVGTWGEIENQGSHIPSHELLRHVKVQCPMGASLPLEPLMTWMLSPAPILAWASVLLLAPGITMSGEIHALGINYGAILGIKVNNIFIQLRIGECVLKEVSGGWRE